jgi:uncharacterized protein YecT (DUF1311 family)
MTKTLCWTAIAAIVLVVPSVSATTPNLNCLKSAQSTADMDNCVGTAYTHAKNDLDAAYAKLLARKGVGDRAALAAAQKQWLRFETADCAYAESLHKGGTLAAVDRGLCLYRDTSDRTAAIRAYLGTS